MNRMAAAITLAHTLLVHYGLILLAASAVVVIALVILLDISRRTIRKQTRSLDVLDGFLSAFKPTNSLEYNLGQITQLAAKVIRAPYYSFYVLDERSNRYVLKTVTHPYDKLESVSPSYSGLSLPKREPYIPPRTMMLEQPVDNGGERRADAGRERSPDAGGHGGKRDASAAAQGVAVRTEGEVKLLELRTPQGLAVLRIGPVEEVPKRIVKEFQRILTHIGPAVDEMVQLTQQKQFLETSKAADEAVQKVASMAVDATAALDAVISVFAGAHSKGGILVPYRFDAGEAEVFGSDLLTETARLLYADAANLERLYALLGTERYRVINRTNSLFYELPSALASVDCGAIALMAIDHRGLLILVFGTGFDEATGIDDDTHASQLGLLAEQLSDISVFNRMQPMLSKAYSNMLWKLADIVDNLNPYTVGYSEMMTRYSLAIGYQLNLNDSELRDLALAAHVSNIGVLGIDPDVLSKKGKYSKFEADTMQMHCDIGASMVRVATGNQRAAGMVLYHHERVDGLGFPSGMTGEQIPVGAKIIHVVQVFLAKINGRSWRSPQTFDEAIQTLRDAVGTQLDETVVKAFIEWFALKQMNPMVQGRSLARCYELLSVPKSICDRCPVSKMPTRNCWEVEDNQCAAHGRECSTCFVYTEYLSRKQTQDGLGVGLRAFGQYGR
ncbi:HD-GYP domain-containing protein [Alicyclobacillus mengziensis]|uniref:HD-GYP domain-containing protein n=1 Tax=Alicyclobacillus mengziensis TaxID=2931921 RepID=A0A9X7VZS6_9BACL|nr:HD domain-containing phosphohydrolase [Alicyclobacillus mengziensis]QSO47562.1 hypothetical protein JZ786_00375 [Alicyclobacillus mengziensis]